MPEKRAKAKAGPEPAFRLEPGKYAVAVRTGEEVHLEVDDDGLYRPRTGDQRQAMEILGAKHLNSKAVAEHLAKLEAKDDEGGSE